MKTLRFQSTPFFSPPLFTNTKGAHTYVDSLAVPSGIFEFPASKIHFDSSQRTRLHLEFGAVREKLRFLDLDPVMGYLSGFYSYTGRPAKNQVQIIRSFILMVMLGCTSLTAWIKKLRADSMLATLIGCIPESLPPLGSYFDFMDRLWIQPKALQGIGRKDLLLQYCS